MSEHDKIRELLAMASAGALTENEELRVSRHARECAACTAEIAEWQALTAGLRRLPTPQPSARLIEITRASVAQHLSERAERRWDQGVMISVLVFGWVLAAASWMVLRFLSGNYLVWLSPEFARPWLDVSLYSGLLWLTGGLAAVMLGMKRRGRQGRTI
jgi:anti-sigma factor RsiW